MTDHPDTTPDPDDVPEPEVVEAEVVEAEVVDGSLEAEPTAAELGLELPEHAAEAQALLLRELMEARGEASEYLETLQRLAADFENYRRRVERDQGENVMRASQRIIEALLPTLDSFDAALAYDTQTPSEEKILDGLKGTHTQLMDTLQREGLEPIAAAGRPFDPSVHEAVSGGGEGELVVAQELRRGYALRGRVIRPSLVTVDQAVEQQD